MVPLTRRRCLASYQISNHITTTAVALYTMTWSRLLPYKANLAIIVSHARSLTVAFHLGVKRVAAGGLRTVDSYADVGAYIYSYPRADPSYDSTSERDGSGARGFLRPPDHDWDRG